MNNTIASSSLVRNLNYSIRRTLSDFLDPQDSWKDVLVSINKPTGEPRYSQAHVRRFESLVTQGKSPTMELLHDWGTSNCTVGELFDILLSRKLLAPASILLPDKVQEQCSVVAAALPDVQEMVNNNTPTRPLGETEGQPSPTRPLGETEGQPSPTRPLGETEGQPSPTRPLGETEGQPSPTRPLGETEGQPSPTRPLGETEGQPSPTRPLGETEEQSAPVSKTSVHVQDGFFRFSFHELERVTGNFDERPISDGGSMLGEGGFGTVYKGLIDEKPVAVKKLKKLHSMEDMSLEELRVQFNQEIRTLVMLKHDNLVRMVGFSCDDDHPCLVYVYMSNGSLLDRLACLDGTPPLSWHRRCWINVGTARGLEYLHSKYHIHRDVKSGNILLDDELVPKISDFGLTRASVSSSTIMTQMVVGTTAYMASEALRGEITPKSDVFSFGVVLLEILSGLPPVDENRDPQLLVDMKAEIEDEELTLEDFIDKKMGDLEMLQVERTFSIAFNCLSDRKNKRPEMKEVLTQLEDVVKNMSVERRSQEGDA